MLEASYQQRQGRVQAGKASASVSSGSRRLRLIGADPTEDSDELIDLSPRGMKIRTQAAAPDPGALLTIELRHPKLRGALSLQGQVRWVDPDPQGRARVGIAFMMVRDTTAVALEQVIASELGSAVHASHGQVGFLAPGREGGPTWVAYDMDRRKLATVSAEGGALQVELPGDVLPCADLGQVLQAVFGEQDLRVIPQLELP